MTLLELRDAVRSGERSAVELCREALDRVAERDGALHAFLATAADEALARAAAIDADRPRWKDAPLAGVPVAIKDNICTRGLRTTAASKILERFVPPYDATAVARLEAAGAIVIGKTNCDEFAMGSSTENSAYGVTRNPWDRERTPGGSSGGSAVAVAAGMVSLALGSDTGGSIRQPAALCGIVGLKPTYGRVSRYGLLAFASSLDQIGPLTTSVADAALALTVIAGPDAADSTSVPQPVPDLEAVLTGEVRGVRVGIPRRLLESGVDAEVTRAFDLAIGVLRARGATIVDIELPNAGHGIPVYYLVATAEASSNLARYDGVRYGYRTQLQPGGQTLQHMYAATREQGFGAEVKRRIMLGTYVLSAGYYDAYYLKAQQVRTLILRDYQTAFDAVDVIATPTTPTPAFRLGEKMADPLQMYLADVFTVSANLTGLPAISVPCGFARGPAVPTPGETSSSFGGPVPPKLHDAPGSEGGLPVGLQLTGRRYDEEMLLRTADAFERETPWRNQKPPSTAAR